MNRRSFLRSLTAAAGALVLPYEPERVYSFGEGVGRIVGLEAWMPDPNAPLFGVDRTTEPPALKGFRSNPPTMYLHPSVYELVKESLGEPSIIVGGMRVHVWPEENVPAGQAFALRGGTS